MATKLYWEKDADPKALALHDAFERAASDAHLHPHDVANGVSGCNRVSDRHRHEHATPQADDIADAFGQVFESKRELDAPRRQNEQGTQQKQHGRIQRQQNPQR